MAARLTRLTRQVVMPAVVFIGVTIVVGVLIVVMGEILLGLHDPHATAELERPELWVALAGSVAVLGGCAFLATRPRGSLGALDRDVAIGSRPFFAPDLPPIDVAARNGPLGTVDDIGPGFMLYARSGALARVVGVIPGGEEFGRRYRAYLYAQGVHGASDELWIPSEVVMAFYPQSRSAFLAIMGDETDTLGCNRQPVHI